MARPLPREALLRKAFAELLGTMFLVATVVGSGIAATRLSPDDVGLQLLQNALITGGILVALILALGPVSAAFNPVVTLVERALGAVTTGQAAVFIAAQVTGGCLGSVLATSFAHSRLNQELAKQRILPLGKFWASNRPFNAPAASLLLHWIVTMIVLFAPPLGQSYDVLVKL